MTHHRLRTLCFIAGLALAAALSGCRDERAAPKQDRETDNLYTRLERIRLAYENQVHRDTKGDRVHPQAAMMQPQQPLQPPPEPGQGTLQTASLLSAPRNFALPHKAQTKLVAFRNAPFPYDGKIARSDQPFYNVVENGKRGHRTPFNRVYWEDETYNDPRVLLHIPRGFDLAKPGVIVLFFHGHGATLERDVVHRQQVPEQISASGVNAVLVAPQLAVDARDSSPGKFWEAGGVKRFLAEAADKLSRAYGDPRARSAFEKMPIVIVAYSGGYLPAAWAISNGGFGRRLKGVVLLDALYGHFGEFRNWITSENSGFFVSAYANSTRAHNKDFEHVLSELNIPVREQVGPALDRDSVVFIETGADTEHRDFVTKAWVDEPIKDLLQKIPLGARGIL